MTQRLRQILLALCVGSSLLGTSASLSIQEAGTTVITPRRLLYPAYDFCFGQNKLYNEYPSPLSYHGQPLGYRLSSEAPLTQSHPEWLVMQNTQVSYAQFPSPAYNSATRYIAFDTKWSFVHQWRLPFGLVLGVGPGVLVEAVTSYSGHNQNNPVDQQLDGDLTTQVLAAYRLHIGWFVTGLRLQMISALVGLGFVPHYNESYLQTYYYDKIINHVAPYTSGWCHYYQIGLSLDIPTWRIMTLRISYDYTDPVRRIRSIYRSFSGHYLGVDLATYSRPFRGYQEIQSTNHTTAISL